MQERIAQVVVRRCEIGLRCNRMPEALHRLADSWRLEQQRTKVVVSAVQGGPEPDCFPNTVFGFGELALQVQKVAEIEPRFGEPGAHAERVPKGRLRLRQPAHRL